MVSYTFQRLHVNLPDRSEQTLFMQELDCRSTGSFVEKLSVPQLERQQLKDLQIEILLP